MDDPSQKFQRLREVLTDMQQATLDLRLAYDELQAEINRQTFSLQAEYDLAPVLGHLERTVNSINIEAVTNFTDDIEEAINDLPFRLKKSYNQYKLAVNPLFKNTPVYFDALNPPEPQEIYKPNKEE